jgi:hypothetical protein
MGVGAMQYISNKGTTDDAWLYELANIPEELRLAEPALRQTRWFDYRDQLPMQLTQTFAESYSELYREMYATTRDYEYAEKVTGGLVQADLLSLWLARQAADRVGCPYGFYIRFSMMRTFERQWKYIPRPNQLYGEELVLDLVDTWASAKKDILFLAKGQFYKAQNFKGHPDQRDYHEYLIQNVKTRAVPEMVLTRLIFREKCLPEELAVKHFGEALVNTAFRHFNA